MAGRPARPAEYVPTLLAVSPLAATRSAPTRTTSTSPRAIRGPAATSAISVCGTPAWASSQAVSRAPWRYGRVSSTQTWTWRPAWWAAWTTPSAVPNWPHASGPVLQWVRMRSGRSSGGGSSARPKSASRPWSVVASRTIASASARSASAIAAAVLRQVADLRRSGPSSGRPPSARLTAVGRDCTRALAPPAQDRPPGVRRRRRGIRSADSASPIAATWPIAGAPRTTISRIAQATSPADADLDLDEAVGQPALVDQVEDAVASAERRPEAGRAAGRGRGGRLARLDEAARACRRRRAGSRIAPAASADARWSAWRGAGDRRRGLDELAGELAEEPAPAEVRVGRGEPRRPRAPRPASGRARAPRPARQPRAGDASGRPWSRGCPARRGPPMRLPRARSVSTG